MLIYECVEKIDIVKAIADRYRMNDVAYFDIETTGFDKEENKVILISIGTFMDADSFRITQYFAEKLEDERELLTHFKKSLLHINRWCSFNGLAFDEPFLQRRMECNSINFIPPEEHIDLYRIIRPYHKQLGIERCSLKSIEKYAGIERKDQIDGSLCVQFYLQYLESNDHNKRRAIMLHNYEDVLNLPNLFKIIYEVENNSELTREDRITEKQQKYVKLLLSKHKLSVMINFDRISKKTASKLIDLLLKPDVDTERLLNIINSNH